MALNKVSKNSDDTLLMSQPSYITPKVYEGIEAASRILDGAESGKTLVYFDPDMDGLVAGLFFCMVLRKRGVSYMTHVNSKRQHGFLLEGKDVSGLTVFNGDFLVTRDNVEDIVGNGANILSIDHHECEPDLIHVRRGGYEGIVINNQYPFEDSRNRFQSGAGVTFEVLREIEPWLDTPMNRALVGITLLTDIRDIDQEGAWAWLWELYHAPYKGYLRYLIDSTQKRSYSYGLPRLDRNFVDYTLSPSVNAMFRFGREEDAVDFILGAGYPNVDFQASQKRLVKKMNEVAHVRDYGHLVVIELDQEDFDLHDREIISNFVGLVCSRYTGNGKSAIGYVVDYQKEVERASFRGNLSTAPYRERMSDHVEGIGHSMAFGIKNLVPSEELWVKLNKICAEAEGESKAVDSYIEVSNLSKFHRSDQRVIAEKNNYKMGPNRIYLRYTGTAIIDKVIRKNFQEYIINGLPVKSFDSNLRPDRDYILAQVEKGRVHYYLQKPYIEEFAQELDPAEVTSVSLP